MTTYYVSATGSNGNNGSIGSPWLTFQWANDHILAGDTVIVRGGTYTGRVTITKANTIWRAYTGETPKFDGGWHAGLMSGGLMPVPTGAMYPTSRDAAFILINASGVTLDGLTVNNSAGRGFGVQTGNNVTIKNCKIDFTYETCFHVNPGYGNYVDDLLVENCTFIRGGNKRITVGFSGNWPGNVNCKSVRDMIFRNNTVAYSQGEGVNIHQYCERVIVEDCIIHNCKMLHLYITRVEDTIFRRNLIFSSGVPSSLDSNGNAYAGIVIGDESSSSLPPSRGSQIYNNLIINCSRGFEFRANAKSYIGSQFKEVYFGFNTIIAGPHSSGCINIAPALAGFPHINSIIENNIFYRAGYDVPIAEGNATGILFRNNLWDSIPTTTFRSASDYYGDPKLSSPRTIPPNVFPNGSVPYNLDHYRPTSLSALVINNACTSTTANGLTPPSVLDDLFKTVRSTPADTRDIGAIEYGITPLPEPPSEPPPGVGTLLKLGAYSIAQQAVGGAVEVDSEETALVELNAVGCYGGLLFNNVTIEKDSQINTAYFAFTPSSTAADSPNIEIDLQAHDNAPAFSTSANYLSGLTMTGNAATYTATNTGVYRLYSSSLVAAVQAVVNRAGWVSGSAFVAVLEALSGSSLIFTSDPLPELVIYYTPPASIPDPPTLSVVASDDDGQQTAAGTMNTNGISLNLTALNDRICMIFRNLPVDPGSTINSTYISGNIPSSTYDDAHCLIQLQDSGSPAALTTGANDISNRTLMAESVTWDERGLGSGWADSPSLVTLFQAFVDRVGYAINDDVAVVLKGLSSALLRFGAFDHTTLDPPRLYLTWTPPEAEPTLAVAASADDGEETAAGTVYPTGISLNLTGTGSHIAMIFRDLTADPGSIFTLARLRLYLPQDTLDSVNCSIQIEDSNAPAAITNATNSISSRTLMTESVTWNQTDIGTTWKETPDLASLLTAYVARDDYVAGSDVAFILTSLSDDQFRCHSFDNVAAHPPELYLSWEAPAPAPDLPEGSVAPDPVDPHIQHYNMRMASFAGSEPSNFYVLPRFVVKARPDQVLLLTLHTMQRDSSVAEPTFTITFGGLSLDDLLGSAVDHSTHTPAGESEQRWTTAIYAYANPHFGQGDITVVSDVQIDNCVISAEMLKLRGVPVSGIYRAGTRTWNAGSGMNDFALTNVVTGDLIFMAHTANSSGAPLYAYTGGVKRYMINNGDSALSISGGSSYHYVLDDDDFTTPLEETGGADDSISGVVVAIRSADQTARGTQFTMVSM